MLLLGCQSYQPRPLDLSGHRDAWETRSAGDESVRALAESLRSDGRSTGVGDFNPDDGLSLQEALVVALVYNADLRLARLRAGIAEATAEYAGLWDDPEFQIDVLRITENIANPWVVTPGLAFTIPVSGRLEAEQARADAALRAALFEVADHERRVIRDLRSAWVVWSATVERARQTERLLVSMESLVESTATMSEAGEMMQTEAALFGIEQSQRRQALTRLRGEVMMQEETIRGLMGLAVDAPVEFMASMAVVVSDSPPVEPMSADTIGLHPQMTRLREQYLAAEQTLRREIRKQYPDLTIGPLYESDAGQSRIGFLGGIPLPILNANRGGIAEAEAERELARAAYETAYEQLRRALASAQLRLAMFRDQRTLLETELGPLVDAQLTDARALLKLGEVSALVLLESVTRAHAVKLELINARQGEAAAMSEILYLIDERVLP